MKNHKIFYLDPSKLETRHVGFTVYSSFLQMLLRFSSYAFVYTAKALAILHCIEIIAVKDITKFVIFTYSCNMMETLASIDLIKEKNCYILYIKGKLEMLSLKNKEIKIVWISADIGISGKAF